MFIGLPVHPVYTRALGSHRCVGTLEAPTSYGNNRLCLRAVGARKLVEILIKGAILSAADCGSKYELHPRCSRIFYVRWKWKKTCAALCLIAHDVHRESINDVVYACVRTRVCISLYVKCMCYAFYDKRDISTSKLTVFPGVPNVLYLFISL